MPAAFSSMNFRSLLMAVPICMCAAPALFRIVLRTVASSMDAPAATP